jgi:hypothetical protein
VEKSAFVQSRPVPTNFSRLWCDVSTDGFGSDLDFPAANGDNVAVGNINSLRAFSAAAITAAGRSEPRA